ncbi:MAG TPA: hypothetical protein VEC36_04185 [Patescibacteria group bacterium]|nr:hypothetical protein [Patescibacteria group bacterium]
MRNLFTTLLVVSIATLASCSNNVTNESKKQEGNQTGNYPAAKVEQININNFHLVDFVGWNSNLTVLARYHSDDVKVFGADGFQTVGMHAHDEWLKKTITSMPPEMKIIQHSPNVASGEWTGVVGTLVGGMKMATVAKWKDGRITEEYLFMALLKPSDAAGLQIPTKPIVSITNANDNNLYQTVDIEPGWSCTMAELNGKRTVFFIKTVGGKEEQRIVFQ